MKRIFLLAIVSVAVLSSCKKEGCTDPMSLNYDPDAGKDDGSCVSVSAQHKALLTDITATWCGPCGSWGAPEFNAAVEANHDNAVPMALHASSSGDPMYNQTAYAIANGMGFGGYPTLSVDLEGDYWNAASLTSAIQAVNASPTVGGSVASMRVNGGTLEIDAMASFFETTTGEFYLGVYIMENGIIYDQAGTTETNDVHDHVLRGSATTGAWGEMISSGEVNSGDSFKKSYSVTADPSWNTDELYVATILWRKSGADYIVVNAN